ncbi:hypothetical protein GIB67_002249, partial [Kingdonia uniflora]
SSLSVSQYLIFSLYLIESLWKIKESLNPLYLISSLYMYICISNLCSQSSTNKKCISKERPIFSLGALDFLSSIISSRGNNGDLSTTLSYLLY